MQIAHILPVNMISEEMPRQNIEMYLTHKVLEHPEVFKFLAKDKENGIETFKILDNSACELGKGMDFDLVLKAARIIGANEIVLPDIPRSGKSACRTLKYWIDLPDEIKQQYNIAAVCQGENRQQLLQCAEQLISLPINTIMLPKWYCSMDSENGLGRYDLTLEILKIIDRLGRTDCEIHWLGCDTGLRELVSPISNFVRSVDTGYFTALSTPQWKQLHVSEDRPRDLKIDLEQMPVDLTRWQELTKAVENVVQDVVEV